MQKSFLAPRFSPDVWLLSGVPPHAPKQGREQHLSVCTIMSSERRVYLDQLLQVLPAVLKSFQGEPGVAGEGQGDNSSVLQRRPRKPDMNSRVACDTV